MSRFLEGMEIQLPRRNRAAVSISFSTIENV